MNSLSWFLYAIDVIGNLKGMSAVMAVCTCGALTMLALGVLCSEGELMAWDGFNPCLKRCCVALAISASFYAVLPTQNTLYAIAASEAGEKLAKTEIASDAMKALQQWIRRQIEPVSKAEK